MRKLQAFAAVMGHLLLKNPPETAGIRAKRMKSTNQGTGILNMVWRQHMTACIAEEPGGNSLRPDGGVEEKRRRQSRVGEKSLRGKGCDRKISVFHQELKLYRRAFRQDTETLCARIETG